MIASNIVVTCAPKISSILADEVRALGYSGVTEMTLGVKLKGTMVDAMKLNLHLRTASRVLIEAISFKARNPDDMYYHASKFPWERHIYTNGYFSINSFVKNDFIDDTQYSNVKLKDAIADRFQKVKGMRPDSGPEKDSVSIFMHWILDECTIYFDTSGDTIAKHGYRKRPFKAPMQEALAAATILASKWDKKSPFINPMCGSGTLAIEAALISANVAPGLFRDNFSFMHLKSFKEDVWEKLIDEAKSDIQDPCEGIIASDRDGLALAAAEANASMANVIDHIKFEKCDFSETTVPEDKGVVMLNPEYGERLGETEDLVNTYTEIGDFFKQQCKGYTGYIFTGNRELGKKVGLKTKRKMEFFNGTIDCRLLEYELYSGTKRE